MKKTNALLVQFNPNPNSTLQSTLLKKSHLTLIALTLLSLIFTGCSSDNDAIEVNPAITIETKTTIRINEIVASNESGLVDEDGDQSDWIELYNTGETAVNMNGWYLTDDEEDLTQWAMPEISLEPDDFIIIFASGKDRTTTQGTAYHTNFKLSGSGEFLAIIKEDGATIVDQYAPVYPAQAPDVSYGYNQDGQAAFLESPSPGAINSQPVVAQVAFSHPPGVFSGELSLEMNLAEDGGRAGTIYYTTDGTAPSITSQKYAAGMTLTDSTIIRARAIDDNAADAPGIDTQGYYIAVDQEVASTTSTLSLVVVDTFGTSITDTYSEQVFAMSIIEKSADGITVASPAEYSGGTKLRIRGYSSAEFPKKQYKLELNDALGNEVDDDLLNMGKESDWILYAPGRYDRNMISNPLMQTLAKNTGLNELKSQFVELYINENGGGIDSDDYRGIYTLGESIKIGKKRIDIEKLSKNDDTEPDITGGYILSIDRPDDNKYHFSTESVPVEYNYKLPPTGEINVVRPKLSKITEAQKDWIKAYLLKFEDSLTEENIDDPLKGYEAYIDVDSWITGHLLKLFSMDVDMLRYSHYMTLEREEKLRFDVLWDFDRSLNSPDHRYTEPEVLWDEDGYNYPFKTYWWKSLFDHPKFVSKYQDRWVELRAGPLSTEAVLTIIDDLSTEVASAYPREQARWENEDGYGSRYTDYAGEISALKNWVELRLAYLDQALFDPI